MTKPAITSRQTKGLALTYAELDTNFANLRDSTIGITAGSGGTQVTSDLNGNITLVAGTNVTLSGDNTAKTITINSSSSGTINSGTDGALAFYSGAGTTLDDTRLKYNYNSSSKALTLDTSAISTEDSLTLTSEYGFITVSGGTTSVNTVGVQLRSVGTSSIINIQAGDYATGQGTPNGRIEIESPLGLRSITTSQRNAIQGSLEDGTIIYNSDTETVDLYTGASTWVSLNTSASAFDASNITGTTLASNVVSSSLTSLGTITNLTTSGTIMSTAPANFAVIDKSSNAQAYANGANVDFGSFSGMIMINRQDTGSGNVALWLCGGGFATKIGDSQGDQSGTIASNGGINGYRWTNNTGGTITCTFCAIRTRNSG